MYLVLGVAEVGLNMSVGVPGLNNLQMGLWHHQKNLDSCLKTLQVVEQEGYSRSRRNIGVRLLIFVLFSRDYILIKRGYVYSFLEL